MISAKDFFPKKINMSSLREAAKNCRGCHLYKDATQTVFSEGSRNAKLIIIGEIPGKKEDETGIPFTGPAGILLRKSIEKSEININDIYFTNIVKHFKYTTYNNKKLHRTPVASEIRACKPWLDEEIKLIHPQIILCLGSTAAKTLVSRTFLITQQRGKWIDNGNYRIIVTFHPSAILRAPGKVDRHRMLNIFNRDLRKVSQYLMQV